MFVACLLSCLCLSACCYGKCSCLSCTFALLCCECEAWCCWDEMCPWIKRMRERRLEAQHVREQRWRVARAARRARPDPPDQTDTAAAAGPKRLAMGRIRSAFRSTPAATPSAVIVEVDARVARAAPQPRPDPLVRTTDPAPPPPGLDADAKKLFQQLGVGIEM